jgi:anaerobic magnesium-protoporphyrin IX monomethyl ester cyclase
MDLLLTHGYFLDEDAKEREIMRPYAPLGILYICSHLRARGFDAEVFDSTFRSRNELLAELQSRPPAVLGVYSTLMTRRNVVEIVESAKQCGWTTVVGGPEAGSYAREYLRNGADYVVIGEGEHTLEELLSALRAGASPDQINGIAFLGDEGELRQAAPRAQIRDLDAQPWPARDAVDIDQYVRTWRDHHGKGSVNLITARGCPYKCRWCSHHVFGMTHRRRNPVKVVDELEFLIDRYRPDIGWVADDVFTIHPGWLFEYAAEMKRRDLRLPFECISRADRINERVADTLAELGCFRVWIGSESGSQRILDSMQRGVTVEQVQAATDTCKQRGIQTGMFLMWGYEGEEIADIEATVEHVKRTSPDVFFTTVAYPIKGTPYFETVADRAINDAEWRSTSDREIRIRGRHSRRFYHFADQLLRFEADLHRQGSLSPGASELQRGIREARLGMRDAYDEVEA